MGSLRAMKSPRTELEKTEDEILRRIDDLKAVVKDIVQAFEEAEFEDEYDVLKSYEQVIRVLKDAHEQPYEPYLYDRLHGYLYSDLYDLVDFFIHCRHETGIDIPHPNELYIFSDVLYRVAIPILKKKILSWDRLDVNELKDMRHDLSKCLVDCLFYPHEPRTIDSIVPVHLIPSTFMPIGREDVEYSEVIAADLEGRILKRIAKEVVVVVD